MVFNDLSKNTPSKKTPLSLRPIYCSFRTAMALCSERTMYRILAASQPVRERRNQLTHPSYTKPELVATGPNETWSWDITRLLGPKRWTYFYLYVLLDIFSRYGVTIPTGCGGRSAILSVRSASPRATPRPLGGGPAIPFPFRTAGSATRQRTHASPQPNDAETVEHRIDRNDWEFARKSLSGEHPVEGIAMRAGQAPCAFGISDADRQFHETLPGDVARTSTAIASHPGSLPIRNLVAISQADAALTTTSFNSSAITSRATPERRSLSAIHQRNAWVSSNASTATGLPTPSARPLAGGRRRYRERQSSP